MQSKQGSIYRVILAIIIGFAFCFALGWPQYAKHRNAAELSRAADVGRSLAFAEESYKQLHQHYTPQFQDLDLSLPCPMVTGEQGPVMQCPHYTYQLAADRIIFIEHTNLPVWLQIDIENGSVACMYRPDDWAGEDLCSRMQ